MSADADILARLARVERILARLAVAPPDDPPSGRLAVAAAAAVLGCSARQVSRYAARGLLVRLPKPAGAAKNTATFFDRANVLALAASEDAAREWVARRKYVPAARRA